MINIQIKKQKQTYNIFITTVILEQFQKAKRNEKVTLTSTVSVITL